MPIVAEYGLNCRCPRLAFDHGIVLEKQTGPTTVASTIPVPRIDLELVQDAEISSGFGFDATCMVCGAKGTKRKPFVPSFPDVDKGAR